jgi:hypothetical protein
MNEQENIDTIPFPDYLSVFNIYSGKEKFLFLPLVSISFTNHEIFGNRIFHFVSIWDTGSYNDDYFNDFRKESRIIRFKILNNKYLYPIDPKFPSIEYLADAYGIIEENFNKNIDYYLTPKNQTRFSLEDKTLTKGAELIWSAIDKFDRHDSGYYFTRITKYLYTKKKYDLFGKVNSSFTYPETFIGLTTTREKVISEFHSYGKTRTELINNLLDKPDWLQKPEEILKELNLIFIGSIDEYSFTDGSAEIYLFWDKSNDEVYQFLQWT